MTRAFTPPGGGSTADSESAEGDDPDDAGAVEAPAEGEHSGAGSRCADHEQVTLEAFGDGETSTAADGSDAVDVLAKIERIDRDVEQLKDIVETLSDAVTRVLDRDGAEAPGDGDPAEDGAGAVCGGDCTDTPDDEWASRGYQ